MKSTSSPQQIAWGVALGILLQAVPPLLLFMYWQVHPLTGEARGWEGIAAPGFFAVGILSMGMWQVLTILPAALLLLPTGKHGVVRGLLYVGTFLATATILVLIRIYVVLHRVTF
jgi:hypothetical protein